MTLVYILLTAGALFMIFPIIWMLSASLKPEWQVFTRPIIWVPQEWHQQEAGNTGRMFNLWNAEIDGETVSVVKIGTINYSTIVDLDIIEHIYSLPPVQVSDPVQDEVDGIQLNIRSAQINGEKRQVVALQRDGDNLLVVEISDLESFEFISKPDFRQSPKLETTIDGHTLDAREVIIDGQKINVVAIGGEIPYSTIIPADQLSEGLLVLAGKLWNTGLRDFGDFQENIFEYTHNGDTMEFINLGEERCFSIVDYDAIDKMEVVPSETLRRGVTAKSYGEVELDVVKTKNTGEEFVLLLRDEENALIGQPDAFSNARYGCSDILSEPRVENFFPNGRLRVMDEFDEQGANQYPVFILDEGTMMATILPAEILQHASQVPTNSLARSSAPKLNFGNYIKAMALKVGEATNFTFFKNSIILVVLNIIGQVISCTVVAYGFARLRAPGKDFLFIVLLATMMLPFPVTMVPVYELFVRLGEFTRKLGMFPIGQDTLWPLFIRSFFGNAFLIFLMRQFFMTIPVELEDAARIDGANRVQMLRYVFLPLLKPALASVVIFTFMWIWNDFLEPLIYLDSASNFTVTLGLNFFQGQYSGTFNLMMAASVLALLPMVLLFFFAQRFFIEGITLTGLKG